PARMRTGATFLRTATLSTALLPLPPAAPPGNGNMTHPLPPPRQGLYDPRYEHDACGVGFVVDLHNRRSHEIVEMAIHGLLNLEHRGACGCEKDSGDGAGLLIQTPHRFLEKRCAELGFALPAPGDYGVGCVFLPTDPEDRRRCQSKFEHVVREEGQT